MVLLLQYAAVILIGYLLGSIPSGYIIGRLKGVNVLEYGSGRTGEPFPPRRLVSGPYGPPWRGDGPGHGNRRSVPLRAALCGG